MQLQCRKKYDLVVASPGGHPKDINLYQSQKALTHAGLIAKKNGVIILSAACPEGTGSHLFEDFMINMHNFNQVIEKFHQSEFHVGPHKAYQIAKQGLRNKIILVSEMAADQV